MRKLNFAHVAVIFMMVTSLLMMASVCYGQNNTTSSFGTYDLQYGTVDTFTISPDSEGIYQCNSVSISSVELKISGNVLKFSGLWSKDEQVTLTCYIADGDTSGERHTCTNSVSDRSKTVCLRIENSLESSNKKLSLAISADSSNCATSTLDFSAKCSNPSSTKSAQQLIVTFTYAKSSSLNSSTLVGGIIAIFLLGAFIIAGGAFGYWYFIQKRREKLLSDASSIQFKKTTLEEA